MELNSLTSINKSHVNSDCDKIAGLYNIGNTIGKGHYAVVKEAKHAFTGEKVAIKVIDKTKLDTQSREHLFSEVMCMKLVQHPNVVRLYEVIDTAHKLYLVLELGDGGDLYDYIMKFENGLPEIKAKRYFRQIVQAISYCHNLHVVHRDLKPENVVFFEKVELVKLTDFGFSNKFIPGKTLDTSCGSLAYSAPEILLGDAYDAPKIDIWSLGVILYMLVCGHLPFEEANDSETLSKIMDCKYDVPSHLSECCKNLIKKMLVRDPEKRSNLADILSDKWLEYENESNYILDSFSVPLISQEHLTVEEHVEILSKMNEGNLASIEEIELTLDRNEYSYISATYFLLAERKLKRRYLENYCKMKLLELEKENTLKATDDLLEELPLVSVSPTTQKSANPIIETNEDRIRRFSMILEDEEDEAEEEELEAMISLASVREELELTMPKFDISSQSGISAPFPSRCCSRLSDSIDPESQEGDTNALNSRFSTFRQQLATRNRCRSAIYNRRSFIYSSHSLTSIPNFTQLLNNIHEESDSRHQHSSSSVIRSPNRSSRIKSLLSTINTNIVVPRFQRNFSASFATRRANSITSSNEPSFDDNFHYLNKHHRISLPTSSHQIAALHPSKKRCSYPALFSSSGGAGSNLSHSHSSSDVSDTELSLLRGFNERKKVAVPKSFGKHFFSTSVAAHAGAKLFNFKPHTPELMMSSSSIDSDGSFAAPKLFCQINRRLRIKSGRSRPNSMGATMSTPFEDFQSQMISEEPAMSPVTSNAPIASSPTVASITMHRDICAPIHEEEELIRSRSYIDKETAASGALDMNYNRSHANLAVCRRKSDSVEGTPAKWAPASRTTITKRPPHKLLDSRSLSSQLTQSNFSLSSFASSLRDSKAMMNLVRGAFELQCIAHKRQTGGVNYYSAHDRYRPDMCASATVSGRESRCEYASVTSLPLGNKLHSPDDCESLLVLRNPESITEVEFIDGRGSAHNVANCLQSAHPAHRKNGNMKKLISHSADQIDCNKTAPFVNSNPLIRAGSNMSRKARFILSCCRPS